MKKLWPFSFFFLYFGAVAAHSPFLVPYFQSLGFSGAQIGALTGISPLITLVTVPIWTNTADRTQRYRLIMGIALLVALASFIVLPLLQSFYGILAAILVASVFLSPTLALANSATMYMLGDEKDLYGRLRVGGTIGFGVTILIAGFLVENYELKLAFWMAAGLFFFAFLVSMQLHYGVKEFQSADEDGSIFDLLRKPEWIFFLVLVFFGGAAFSVGNSYFFPFLGELGIQQSAMGAALTIGTIAEIPVLLTANWFLKRFNAYGTLILASVFTGLRLVMLGLVEEPALIMVIQVINGVTIPLMMVAAVAYADQLAPVNLRATGQGLVSAVMFGVGTAVGGFAGGILLEGIGGQQLHLFTGVILLVVLPVLLFLRGRISRAAVVDA